MKNAGKCLLSKILPLALCAAVLGVSLSGCSPKEAESIGIIGGADGPTAIIVGKPVS